MNNLVITGNLGKDPKLAFSKDGKAVASFSLAVGQRAKKDGEWVDVEPMWFQVTFFGIPGERVVDRYKSGDTVTVSGRLGQSSYVDKEGVTRSSIDIVGFDILKIERQSKGAPVANESAVPF